MKKLRADIPTGPEAMDLARLGQLLNAVPDRELALAAELVLHHFLQPTDLRLLALDDFVFDGAGDLFAVRRCRGMGRHHQGINYFPLVYGRRSLIKALLPTAGRLFSDQDPFGRLQRFADRIGLRLSRRGARAFCIARALAAGLDVCAVAALAGYVSDNFCRHHFNPIQHSPLCQGLPYDLDRIAALPRHCRRTTPGVKE